MGRDFGGIFFFFWRQGFLRKGRISHGTLGKCDVILRLSVVCRQVLKQHATVWSAEAEAVAGGADSVWQVPRSHLAGPGKPAPPHKCVGSTLTRSFES